MVTDNIIICSGCSLKLPNKNLGPSKSYNASGECMELFNELSGYTLSMTDSGFIHQYIVDAYGAQHAGVNTKPIRVMFSLIGLCLAVEHNYSGRQVQLIHMKIPKQLWQVLEPPLQKSAITVAGVLNTNNDIERRHMILDWSPYHEWIRNKTSLYIK